MVRFQTSGGKLLVRRASLGDTRQMAEISGVITSRALADWMDDAATYAAWHVAENAAGTLHGFQRIGAGNDSADGACEIATFLRRGSPMDVGSRLFEASVGAAALLGYAWIDAKLAQGNDTARIYYQSHGFRLIRQTEGQFWMRYEID